MYFLADGGGYGVVSQVLLLLMLLLLLLLLLMPLFVVDVSFVAVALTTE